MYCYVVTYSPFKSILYYMVFFLFSIFYLLLIDKFQHRNTKQFIIGATITWKRHIKVLRANLSFKRHSQITKWKQRILRICTFDNAWFKRFTLRIVELVIYTTNWRSRICLIAFNNSLFSMFRYYVSF